MTHDKNGWTEVALGDICEFRYGKSLPASARQPGPYPVFGSNGEVGVHRIALSNGPTIIIGRKGSFGEVTYSGTSCWPIDTTYYIDNTSTEVDLLWLSYRLRQIGLKGLNRAAAVPGLNRDDAYRLRLLLPPLAEQRRIAGMLDRAEALRHRRHNGINLLDTLERSIFFSMFGRHEGVGDWEIRPLSDLVSEFRYGTSQKSDNDGYPTLRIPNIVGGGVDVADLKLVPIGPKEFERLRLMDGDLLFVRTNGNVDYVGRCAVFTQTSIAPSGWPTEEFVYASYLIRARLRHDVVHPVFVKHFMLSPAGRRALREQSRTSAGQYNISVQGLGQIRLPVPSVALQREFASRVAAIEALKARQEAQLAEIEELFAAVQYRAFRGELWEDSGG